MAKKKKAKSGYDRLVEDVSSIVRGFQPILKQAEKLGIFLGDRELLDCKKCGLEEDVTTDGVLIVTNRRDRTADTRLRFKELKKRPSYFKCPGCKTPIRVKKR
jgi:hypothetical protein